jgi:hypothetical protein
LLVIMARDKFRSRADCLGFNEYRAANTGRGARLVPFVFLVASALLAAFASPAGPLPDDWVRLPGTFPAWVGPGELGTNGWDALRADVVAERLKIYWDTPVSTNANVVLYASDDPLGHWPARDWRAYAMIKTGNVWESTLPVEDLDVPIAYFVRVLAPGATNASPMRVVTPRDAGLEMPTRYFWPFLEGFEEGLEAWTLLGAGPGEPPLAASSTSKSGRAALLVTLPPGKKRSASIGTTRLRGTKIASVGAKGVSLWMRTVSGKGRARFTLFANAFTTNQVTSASRLEAGIGPNWSQVGVLFGAFDRIPLPGVDYFAIDFIGDGATEFLLDDIQLMGPWRND